LGFNWASIKIALRYLDTGLLFKDFFKSAEALLNNSNSTGIDFRNLISRSCYAVFLLS